MAEDVLWTSIGAEKGEFWNIVATNERSQLTVMTVEPGRVAGGPNTHAQSDQFALVAEGEALIRCWEDGPDGGPTERACGPGSMVLIPAGVQHWVKSVGDEDLYCRTGSA